ncbi:hypothetical protein GUJ93_ZPchr0006g45894 [Zizania palustris]|uniref:SEP domain-containing protein n=1 Tax=Zizania palustris TaxID=103762 RepID=A0A8J5T8F9_ZIZPA|nr:hypothetical protein GUJ93_ZPchr0006g45894 [Zizania palustris]
MAPAAAEAQSLVESFCAVTSATLDEAAFFLESHNWALDSAVRSFYDSTDGDAADPAPQPLPPPADGGGAVSEEDEDYVGGGAEDQDDYDCEAAPLSAAAAVPTKRLKRVRSARGGSGSGSGGASGKGNVRMLSDLGGGRNGEGSDEDSQDEWSPPPELYTGGEKSGMVVRDRSKRNVDEVFKKAKTKGAKQGLFKARRKSSRSFTGTGRLLTGETVESDAPQPPENIVHNIYFWSNGFTVNDGPFRSFDDPANASFLAVNNSDLGNVCSCFICLSA